ncbi:hypothetical protein EES43_28960 [Streptomyces sp. ADI96-02]|uniref:hypothetical protein n=1 Tax=Streptomyces sp. ADI96-02 TaxID=1522760 RepID=UPI000F54DC3B|nr:hypothetical protein [Streptomyces sp. ADI96-02]RPK54606.1 hypothetical protein EES43_28960 [Streptomyces sp. ADI96-02]
MRKRAWITAAAAGLVLTATTGAYLLTNDGDVTVSSVCAPPAGTPEYVAAYAPTVVIGTVTGPTRYIPDADDPSTGVQVATLTVEKTLKGSSQSDMDLSQAVSRTAQGTYTTAEPLYQPLVTGQRYAVAVLDRTESSGRWVWGAERTPDGQTDDRWAAAVAAKAVLPTAACDDTLTLTSTPAP